MNPSAKEGIEIYTKGGGLCLQIWAFLDRKCIPWSHAQHECKEKGNNYEIREERACVARIKSSYFKYDGHRKGIKRRQEDRVSRKVLFL